MLISRETGVRVLGWLLSQDELARPCKQYCSVGIGASKCKESLNYLSCERNSKPADRELMVSVLPPRFLMALSIEQTSRFPCMYVCMDGSTVLMPRFLDLRIYIYDSAVGFLYLRIPLSTEAYVLVNLEYNELYKSHPVNIGRCKK